MQLVLIFQVSDFKVDQERWQVIGGDGAAGQIKSIPHGSDLGKTLTGQWK